MSKIKHRDTAPGTGGSVDDRLARLLDMPSLTRLVPLLPPEALHQVIRHRGLDACGELVTSATPAQLASVLDLDLWRTPTGRDEQFDVRRFGEWIETLVNTGSSIAARTVAGLDANLVVAGLSRYVRVFDPGIFEPVAQSDDEPADRDGAMREGDSIGAGDLLDDESGLSDDDADPEGADGLECEIGGYILRAKRHDGWDAIVDLLVALDAGHGSYFHTVMRGCRSLSNSRPELDGLDDLLRAPEQHLFDVAVERERRRSERGYAASADARAFLQMARQPQPSPETTSGCRARTRHPIVEAYLRASDAARDAAGAPASEASLPGDPPDTSGVREADGATDAVIELLTEAGLLPEPPRALLEAAGARDDHRQDHPLALLRRLMLSLRDRDDGAYFTRSRELAFLANTLLAGCSVQSRPFTPQEASDAAASVCNLGLEHWPGRWPGPPRPNGLVEPLRATAASLPVPPHGPLPDSFLVGQDLITAFEVGWSVLHQDVSLFVARQLVTTLDGLHVVDRDVRRGVAELRRTLVREHDAGTPWRARDVAEVLAQLDMTAWVSVLGLLDECPIVPAALTAILDRRTKAVDPAAFSFISTAAQIENIRGFMAKLGEVLS